MVRGNSQTEKASERNWLEIRSDAVDKTEDDLQPWSSAEEGTVSELHVKCKGIQWVQKASRKRLFPRTVDRWRAIQPADLSEKGE